MVRGQDWPDHDRVTSLRSCRASEAGSPASTAPVVIDPPIHTIPPVEMRRTLRAWRRLVKGDEALAISEYALLVAFIAIVVVAVLTLFGGQVSGWLSNRTGTITTV